MKIGHLAQVDQLQDAAGRLSGATWFYVLIGGLLVLVALWLIYRMVRGKRGAPAPPGPDLTIRLDHLGEQGPPPGTPELEFYHMPVRLAAVIIAPAGRIRELPPIDQMDPIYDALLPGLDRVVEKHGPLIRRWPPQMSAQGFARTVFQNCRLPGEGGKGTPWSTVAGLFRYEGQAMMGALVLRTGRATSHGQYTINAEHEWLGCLRIKGG
ncbi:MAG: hypothetical protein ACOC46_01695 [Pirellulales bacterium]